MLTKQVRDALCAPIPASEIGWKPQVTRQDSALMVAYVDARWVAERLDEAADGDWSFTWEDYGVKGDNLVIKSKLTVCGVLREDVGEHRLTDRDPIDPYKSAVSDALKRAAVLFGVGRELYRMDAQWIKWDSAKRQPMPGEMERLIARMKTEEAWVKDAESVEKFFEWASTRGLNDAETLAALKVKTIVEYKGSKRDAVDAVTQFRK